MNNREYRTAADVYRAIVGNQFLKDYTVIITGKTGPTGKTTLCKLLNNAGVRAIEISEDLNFYVEYSTKSNKNNVIINEFNETVLVVLNRLRSSEE